LDLLFLYVGFALAVSHLCSLLEASFLSVRLAALAGLQARGSTGAARLLELKQHRVDDAISAVLILNTLANTLGATLAGAQAAKVFGAAWVGVFSGVLTLLILVFSEIIPKTLGAVYARGLAGFVGHALHLLTRLMAPALFVSGVLTRALTRSAPDPFSRGELQAMIAAAAREGALSAEETRIFDNLLRFHEIEVGDVMTPRPVVFMLGAEQTVAELLREPEADAFSRIPLYRGDRDNVIGYALQREVLKAVATGCDTGQPLERLLRPISFVPVVMSVGDALSQLLRQREPIAMVADELGGLAGLVTLEDLTETLLGAEIVDESDFVVDLRQAAAELRQRRLERMRRKREQASGSPASTGPSA
jgi:CBS domain containing-hemolysin-like protein